ncbi:MAG: hypothetical protein FJ145_14045 [Deltaproteobacteria bacterium]|nr:hypothetical protein [Deltaproteobacteria bacterium]
MTDPDPLSDLPSPVPRVLTEFIGTANAAFVDELKSIVLYGSAGEGRLREASKNSKSSALSSPLIVSPENAKASADQLMPHGFENAFAETDFTLLTVNPTDSAEWV